MRLPFPDTAYVASGTPASSVIAPAAADAARLADSATENESPGIGAASVHAMRNAAVGKIVDGKFSCCAILKLDTHHPECPVTQVGTELQ